MAWSFSPNRPVYLQLAERIQKSIISGQYAPGTQIPSVRQIATEATVNPNTVQHALTELEGNGIIETRGTLGRFVTEDLSIIEACKEKEAKELVDEFLKNADQMSIPRERIITMIKEAFDEHS